MSLPQSIIARKSFKTFTSQEVAPELMDELSDYLSTLTLLYDNLDWNFDTLPHVDLMRISVRGPGVTAPMYLVLRSEKKLGCLQNIGYLGEMAALWLTDKGLATMWQGSVAIDPREDFSDSLPYISCLALGYSDESFRHSPSEAIRKPVSALTFGSLYGREEYIQGALLAPSYCNRQMNRFVVDEKGDIHVYRHKAILNNPVLTYQDCVGAGAAIANLEAVARGNGLDPRTYLLSPEPRFRNFVYQASVHPGDR